MAKENGHPHRALAIHRLFSGRLYDIGAVTNLVQDFYGAAFCPTLKELRKARSNNKSSKILRSMCFYTRGIDYKFWDRIDLYYKTRSMWKQRGGQYERRSDLPFGVVELTLDMLCPDVMGYYDALDYLKKHSSPPTSRGRAAEWTRIHRLMFGRKNISGEPWDSIFMQTFMGIPDYRVQNPNRKRVISWFSKQERELVPMHYRGVGKEIRDETFGVNLFGCGTEELVRMLNEMYIREDWEGESQ